MSAYGNRLDEIDTPALWVDLEIMQRNVEVISKYLKLSNVNWRPHTKGIKIPSIAQELVHAGAIGITCSKLSEAEVMADGGIKDILIANEIVGDLKARRLVKLRKQADVMVCLDSYENARAISNAAVDAGLKLRVLVELDTGMGRCGVQPGQSAVEFVRQIHGLLGLDFAGLMSWEGHTAKIDDEEQKRKSIQDSVGKLVETAEMCRAAGLSVKIVSCGGTGTYRITAGIPGITEVQAGGGIFGDVTYQKWGAGVDCSLFILATVISIPAPGRAVIDAGRKAMNIEYSYPEPRDLKSGHFQKFSAEHAVINYDPDVDKINLGDKINLVVGYGDLTMFLHDVLYGVRNNRIQQKWDILGRGKIT
jgi:D-serine deaminase-like pyridoxal phosphate-dependent protein